MNTLHDIRIKIVEDEDSDLSYLEPGMNPEYDKENAERLASFGTYWHTVGLYAEAVIHVPTECGGYSSSQTLRTPGLWCIESDSDKNYFREVAQEELWMLEQILTKFSVSLDNWEEESKSAIDAM